MDELRNSRKGPQGCGVNGIIHIEFVTLDNPTRDELLAGKILVWFYELSHVCHASVHSPSW